MDKRTSLKRTGERDERAADLTHQTVRVRKNIIDGIAQALRSCGYKSLDQQAKALGLNRATTWTIIKNKHKVGRLSQKTTGRILTHPETPRAIRAVVNDYLAVRMATVSRKARGNKTGNTD